MLKDFNQGRKYREKAFRCQEIILRLPASGCTFGTYARIVKGHQLKWYDCDVRIVRKLGYQCHDLRLEVTGVRNYPRNLYRNCLRLQQDVKQKNHLVRVSLQLLKHRKCKDRSGDYHWLITVKRSARWRSRLLSQPSRSSVLQIKKPRQQRSRVPDRMNQQAVTVQWFFDEKRSKRNSPLWVG